MTMYTRFDIRDVKSLYAERTCDSEGNVNGVKYTIKLCPFPESVIEIEKEEFGRLLRGLGIGARRKGGNTPLIIAGEEEEQNEE